MKLSKSAKKVQRFLEEHGYELSVKELPDSTRTAQNAADAIGCEVGQIGKSLIFKQEDEERAVLIVASGQHQVDIEKVEAQLGFKLEKADAKFVKAQSGFAIGGVPPIAHANAPITVLDKSLQNFDTIWAAAGTPSAVFELTSELLASMTSGTWLDVAKH